MTHDKLLLGVELGDKPLGILLDKAGKYGIVTPDLDVVSQIASNAEQFARNWRTHQSTKLFLLALRVARAEIAEEAASRANDPEQCSNEELRALLIKQYTIDRIISYAEQTKDSFESGGGIGWR